MSHFKKNQAEHRSLVTKIDDLIRSGNTRDAVRHLSHLNLSRTPRQFRVDIAKACRRVGLLPTGLRALHPIIRNPDPGQAPASAEELCEYAVLLSRIGSIDEALSILLSIDENEIPQALLYRGFCHVSKWEYVEARPYFEAHLNTITDPYPRLITQVNLAACHVAVGDLTKAEALLDELIEKAPKFNAIRLTGNCLELLGQVYVLKGDFTRADLVLRQAEVLLSQNKSYDQLLIQKWRSVIHAQTSNDPTPLIEFRALAADNQHWESVREADLFLLTIDFEQSQLDHLIHGTPSSSYHQRVIEMIEVEPSLNYIWGSPSSRHLNLETGKLSDGHSLNPGKQAHQVLSALLMDFYRPINIGSLFSQLFPDQYYDVNTSPLRVRQALSRTRQWLCRHDIPLAIDSTPAGYCLRLTGELGVSVALKRHQPAPHEVLLKKLTDQFTKEVPFTAAQACQALDLSRSSFHRLIDWAIEQNKVARIGRSRSTKYKRVA